MKLAAFLDEAHEAIADAVLRAYPPLYNAETRRSCGFDVRRLGRRPLGAQADAIRAVALSLQRQPGTILVGEMGVGKSTIAAAAAYLGGCRQVFLLCPPHLVRKWQREIHQTVPGACSVIVRTIQDLERTRNPESRLQFTICSRELAKLGYRWRPATVLCLARDSSGEMLRDEAGRPYRVLSCPTCFGTICDDEGIPLGLTDLSIRKRRCSACNGPLWQADRTGPRRFPLAEYVRRRMQRHFDLLIVDYIQSWVADGNSGALDMFLVPSARGRGLGPDAARALTRDLLSSRGWRRVTVDRAWHRAVPNSPQPGGLIASATSATETAGSSPPGWRASSSGWATAWSRRSGRPGPRPKSRGSRSSTPSWPNTACPSRRQRSGDCADRGVGCVG